MLFCGTENNHINYSSTTQLSMAVFSKKLHSLWDRGTLFFHKHMIWHRSIKSQSVCSEHSVDYCWRTVLLNQINKIKKLIFFKRNKSCMHLNYFPFLCFHRERTASAQQFFIRTACLLNGGLHIILKRIPSQKLYDLMIKFSLFFLWTGIFPETNKPFFIQKVSFYFCIIYGWDRWNTKAVLLFIVHFDQIIM